MQDSEDLHIKLLKKALTLCQLFPQIWNCFAFLSFFKDDSSLSSL